MRPLSHTIITVPIPCASQHCERSHTSNRALTWGQLIDVIFAPALMFLSFCFNRWRGSMLRSVKALALPQACTPGASVY